MRYAVTGLFLVVLAAGCGGGSKFSGDGDADDMGDTDDVALDTLDDGDDAPDAADVPSDGDGDAEADTAGECVDATDCEDLYGAAPCGSWECNAGACEVDCPGCTDADRDGYGTGSCAGPDCDDADDTIFDSHSRSCYSGPGGTAGVGTCLEGTEVCTDGLWSPCVGEVVPSGEACNLEDDDCDGSTDEDLGDLTCGIGACLRTVPACTGGVVGTCVPGTTSGTSDPCGGGDEDCDGAIDEDCSTCVPVSPTGDDSTADGSTTNPFRNIQTAIDWAAADSTRPRRVCVAAGSSCSSSFTYSGSVTMSNGISVYANYRSTDYMRCTSSTTVIAPGRAEGVLFPSSVSTTTVLDGFRIDRHASATTAAVTVDGASGVILSNLRISNAVSVTNSYGVNMLNGAQALIMRSWVDAGTGSAESIAVRSIGSTPTIRDNCQRFDTSGHCDEYCSSSNEAIRGRFTPGTGVTYGVYLEDSPGAIVERSALCGIDADRGAMVGIRGDAAGTLIRANLMNAWGGAVDSHGIWLENCDGEAPWIVDNFLIAASGDSSTTRVDGIRSIGDCHPVIDSNVRITGGGEGGTTGANGVYCGADPSSGVASQCVVLGNLLIEGSEFGYPPTSVGVRCDDDGCMRIAGNVITGRAGVDVWGIHLGSCGTFIDGNVITGGCGTSTATGIHAEDAFARIQNNLIMAGSCNTGSVSPGDFTGLHVVSTSGMNEIDVHSNTIDGGGASVTCDSTGLALGVTGTPPPGGEGIFRNNIITGGLCSNAYVVFESVAAADPRIFENNDLDPRATPTALYVDEGTTNLSTHTAVNALTDMTVGGIISADPLFTAYPTNLHIGSGSPCDGAGTVTGAPAFDMDGDARSTTAPDIGADEI